MLAHELGHIDTYSKMKFSEFALYSMIYILSDLSIIGKDFQIKVERSTDIIAIEHGFGKELENYRIRRLNTGTERDKKYIAETYLSPEEIRSFSNDNYLRNRINSTYLRDRDCKKW